MVEVLVVILYEIETSIEFSKQQHREVQVDIKAKLAPCFNRVPPHEGVMGELRYSSKHS